jgi:FkbM family methyltransferase
MAQIPKSVLRIFRPMNYYRFLLWRVKIFQIYFHSRVLNQGLYKTGQKGLFLDCGSNIGQGFEFFRKYYPNGIYDYILFEPNPFCYQELLKKYSSLGSSGVRIENTAVGIANGDIDFFGLDEEKGGKYSVGGSILQHHNSKIYTTPNNASLKVPSINFAIFLQDILMKNQYSTVIIKLDIEGGEYSVLDSLISNNLLARFESIYVEFHSQYMSNDIAAHYRSKEQEFLKYSKKNQIRVIQWI